MLGQRVPTGPGGCGGSSSRRDNVLAPLQALRCGLPVDLGALLLRSPGGQRPAASGAFGVVDPISRLRVFGCRLPRRGHGCPVQVSTGLPRSDKAARSPFRGPGPG